MDSVNQEVHSIDNFDLLDIQKIEINPASVIALKFAKKRTPDIKQFFKLFAVTFIKHFLERVYLNKKPFELHLLNKNTNKYKLVLLTSGFFDVLQGTWCAEWDIYRRITGKDEYPNLRPIPEEWEFEATSPTILETTQTVTSLIEEFETKLPLPLPSQVETRGSPVFRRKASKEVRFAEPISTTQSDITENNRKQQDSIQTAEKIIQEVFYNLPIDLAAAGVATIQQPEGQSSWFLRDDLPGAAAAAAAVGEGTTASAATVLESVVVENQGARQKIISAPQTVPLPQTLPLPQTAKVSTNQLFKYILRPETLMQLANTTIYCFPQQLTDTQYNERVDHIAKLAENILN